MRFIEDYDRGIIRCQLFKELLAFIACIDLRISDEYRIVASSLKTRIENPAHLTFLNGWTWGTKQYVALRIHNGRLAWIAQYERVNCGPNVRKVAVHVGEQLRIFGEKHRDLTVDNRRPNDGRTDAPLSNSCLVTDDERPACVHLV